MGNLSAFHVVVSLLRVCDSDITAQLKAIPKFKHQNASANFLCCDLEPVLLFFEYYFKILRTNLIAQYGNMSGCKPDSSQTRVNLRALKNTATYNFY